MAKAFTLYRVFVGSPGGLIRERELFRDLLLKVTSLWAAPRGVTFEAVGWEDTVAGRGRPQELINEDLRTCDYAVFVLHDRWGSPHGRFSSGTKAELSLAEDLCREGTMRDIAIFFKKINKAASNASRGDVRKIREFRESLGGRYLFKEYESHEMFAYYLEASLAKWLRDHEDEWSGLEERTPIPTATDRDDETRSSRLKKTRRR